DWKAYLKGRGNAKLDMVVVTTPDYFKALDGLLTSTPAATWRDYLRFNAAFGGISTTFGVSEDVSFGLPKKFDDEDFAFNQKLTGVASQPERWKRCVNAVDGAMDEALAQPYIAKMFPG